MKADITRRRVLWALVAVGATVGLARLARLPPFDSRVRGSLRALLTDLASAERVGSAYVEQHPEEADPALLEARIAGSQADAERIFGEMRPDELASWIWNRQQEDFRAGRTVSVDGWILSETEALLCARVYLD